MTNATRTPRCCPVCANDFAADSSGPQGIYCCIQCKHRASNRRRRGKPIADNGPQPTSCPVCRASLEGRRRNTQYCSEPCAQRAKGRRKRGQKVEDNANAKICMHCGDPIEAGSHRQTAKFCSRRCSLNFHCALYAERRRPVLLRRCLVCAEDIPPGDNLRKKYCSPACRDRRNRPADVVFRYVNARRARLAGATARPLPKRLVRRLRAAACTYCGKPGGTVDHVVPLSRGGQHAEGNLVPACRSCNSSKADKLLIEWLILRRANQSA
jgi:5-methylcytosine-specific restriction endonuclease McrA